MDKLAKQQTCQLFIEQEIDKGLASGKTPVSIAKELQSEIKKYFQVTLEKRSLERRARRAKHAKEDGTDVPTPKPARKHTKPEVKKQLEQLGKSIKHGEVSDDDVKEFVDIIGDGITAGKLAPRVATKAATAVTKAFKKNAPPPKRKEPDTFLKLSRLAMSFQEGLQFWADQTIKPKTKDEIQYGRVIRAASTSIITNYARLGIDVVGIYDTFYKGKGEGHEKSRKALPEKL